MKNSWKVAALLTVTLSLAACGPQTHPQVGLNSGTSLSQTHGSGPVLSAASLA